MNPSVSPDLKVTGMINGSVDKITCESAVGWIYNKEHENSLSVQAVLHDSIIGQANADIYRPDLEQVGFGDGRCGFEIKFNERIAENYLPFVSIKPSGYNLSIPLTDKTIFYDFVSTLQQGYPGTGRNRSLLGGLWTDRFDALQLLSSRIGLGIVPPDLQPRLQSYIVNGYVGLDDLFETADQRKLLMAESITTLPRSTDKEIAAIQNGLWEIIPYIFEKSIQRVLQSVFDDNPVAYRLDWLTEPQSVFTQISTIESFPSPTECTAIYFAVGKGAIDVIRGSHEFPEFTSIGHSRWVATASEEISQIAVASGSSIDTVDFEQTGALICSPGLLHRVQASTKAPILRVLCAPKRITPERYLTGENMWIEASHPAGARIRL